jgi:hypothetical protein
MSKRYDYKALCMPTNPFCSTPPPLNIYKKGEFKVMVIIDHGYGIKDPFSAKDTFDVILDHKYIF